MGFELTEKTTQERRPVAELLSFGAGLLDFRNTDLTITVGPETGKDFATINEALEHYRESYYPLYKSGGFLVKIEISTGFTMSEQVLVSDFDYSGVVIVSEAESDSSNITAIERGTQIQASAAEISTVQVTAFSIDASDLHGDSFTCFTPDGSAHTFYYEVDGQGEIDNVEGTKIDILATDTPSEVAGKTQTVVNANASLTATVSTDTVTVTNDTEGAADDTQSQSDYLTVTTTQQGQDQWDQAKFTTGTAHGLSNGDEVIIKDHYGEIEEHFYNGIWTVTNTTSTSFELSHAEHGLDAIYDDTRAGSGDTGETVRLVEIPVARSALTTLFEYFYYPAFGVARGTLPTIGCVFSMDTSANAQAGYMSYLDGICGTDNFRINLLPYSGFRNADGSNIYGTRTGTINANDAIATGAGRHNVWAYSNVTLNARRVFADNAGHNGVSADRGDGWDGNGEPVGCCILADRGAIVNAEGSNALNAQGDCVLGHAGGIVNIGNTTEQGTIAGGSVNGLAISAIGGTINGYGSFGRHALVGDRIIGDSGYDKEHVGPKSLIAGNMDCGFFGEVTPEELFGTGNDSSWLITDLGITQGSTLNQTRNWLKLAWKGKVIFYPMTSIQSHISWDHIYIKGCVYGTGQTISNAEREMLDNAIVEDGTTIYKDWLLATEGVDRIPQTAQTTLNGKTYRVRLMKGVNDDPAPGSFGRPGVGMNNQWNRLILPLYYQTKDYNWQRVIDGTDDYSDYVNSKTPDWGVYYDDEDLLAHYSLSNGSRPWMQEFTKSHDPQRRVLRGHRGATYLLATGSWDSLSNYGFRPVLESL